VRVLLLPPPLLCPRRRCQASDCSRDLACVRTLCVFDVCLFCLCTCASHAYGVEGEPGEDVQVGPRQRHLHGGHCGECCVRVLGCACVCALVCLDVCLGVLCFAWMYGVRVRASQHMYAPKNNNGALEMFTITCITSVARTARCTGNGGREPSFPGSHSMRAQSIPLNKIGLGRGSFCVPDT
jgi:hypothetical protein